jgi:hypothetical protein
LIEAPGDGPVGDLAGYRVGCKRACVVAKHVAWKLVQQDDERERAFGTLLERAKSAARGCLVRLQKA